MTIAIVILITILWLVLQDFLSKRNNFIFGLIIPTFILIGGVLLFTGPRGTKMDFYPLIVAFGFSMSVYFSGRDKVKKKKKKELEKMTIKDL
ncbi:hypothetical protein [Clostridium tagluense]|uniref:hypothetical protein n=1 Tax=Clostridium tagluense TaxID=360422 RepID=UPI001CF58C84|nr:hypothetical protein [Clostridium tagluense]MCB2298909.1 hypothetical protein [Clostridium tagluense]